MECWPLSYKHKSWLYWLLMLMMIVVLMVRQTEGHCIEEERNTLLKIKASFMNPYGLALNHFLPTWIDNESTIGGGGSECCNWERVKCNTTTGHVTMLSLDNLNGFNDEMLHRYKYDYDIKLWPLNVSLFLHFEDLRSLNLSFDFLNNGVVNTELEKLSSLKNLETLDLSFNYDIDNDILPPLAALTSLRILDLSNTSLGGYFPTKEFAALKNLEMLDLTDCSFHGTFQMQGFESLSIFPKLKTLNLRGNQFNESLITSLSVFPSLKTLDLSWNELSGTFPAQELAQLTNLEKLDLSGNWLDGTSSIQDCKSLSRLKRLDSLALGSNGFNKSIISCLSALPSLKTLDLSYSFSLGSSFPIQELSGLRDLETLDMSWCELYSLALNGTMTSLLHLNLHDNNFFNKDVMSSMSAFPSLRFLSLEACNIRGKLLFAEEPPNLPHLEVLLLRDNHFNGTLPIEALASFHHLEVLDLSFNRFTNALSFANGSLPNHEPPNLPHLEVLLLRNNDFNGTLPIEALASFHHLEVLDLSHNRFTGNIPSTIKALSSLRALSFANNALGGSLPDHGFCELKNLQELDLSRNMFGGNLPQCFNNLSSLKLFDIFSNQFTGILLQSLIANLTSLEYLDFSHNKFEGSFSFSSFSNLTKLEVVKFVSDNDKFEVETEEPIGWIPMFQLKVLVLSNCNMNRPTQSVVPGFLLHQHKLGEIDLSHNSLEGQFPDWLITNNTMLKILHLRDNSLGGTIRMPLYRNVDTQWLDLSGNKIKGTIPGDIQKFLPYISYLNLSWNALSGAIPTSVGDLSELRVLDLSDNELSGEVPKGLFTNISGLSELKLSKNRLHGQVLSGNLSLGSVMRLHLDSNCFTGKIGNGTSINHDYLWMLDISNNVFTGMFPYWISNMSWLSELVVRNNSFEGQFPCGRASFSFLDISHNSFSGPIPSCINWQYMKHLHLGSNAFTGSIPHFFRNLTHVLTLDIGNNNLSYSIPEFMGELSNLRILLLRENNFSGSIPKQLCQLRNVSLIDLSRNSLSGSIPRCLQNITGPSNLAFMQEYVSVDRASLFHLPRSTFLEWYNKDSVYDNPMFKTRDEVQFTTKTHYLPYKGDVLDIMSGLDLSCNKLTGEIPEELGLLTQIHALNLSHNQLTGPIPGHFSNLANIESLDLSSNGLSGRVPSQLINLNYLEYFNVSHNNLSGRLPDMKAQFSTFTKESYEGNPLLCGPPLEKKCTTKLPVTVPSQKEGTEKWYDIDMACFYGSSSSTWVVFLLGFAAFLHTNPYYRRRWLDFVEKSMYTCYYFFYDSVHKLPMLFYR